MSEEVWSARDCSPDAIEAALRQLLHLRYEQHEGYVPARVLNMVAIVDREWKGEIQNRLEGVGRYHASRFHAAPDFAAIARGFGMEACDLETVGDPASALARAFASDGPCLVRVPIAAAENVYPMVRPGAPNREMIDEAALQAGEDGGCDAAEASGSQRVTSGPSPLSLDIKRPA